MHREMDSSSATKMPQSLNSPTPMEISAADSTPVSGIEYTDGKKCGKLLSVLVVMLDDSAVTFEIQHKAYGQVLFDQVCKQLNLLEVDYFGLEYADASGCRFWLDHEKPMNRQLGLSLVAPELRFCVKFYTPCPAQLEEEYTRYLFCLQMKYDLAQGILQCNDNTSALMASYIVQADCGDYVAEDYPDHTYLSSYKFVPHQDVEMERRIMENHKRHVGQTPAEADLNLLETARRCELYGIKMHPAKDHEGVSLNLAIAHMGVLVFQNITKINTFSWAKIRKLSFKRKRFLLKLHPEGYGYYKDTVEFYFEGRDECKNFWKKCVEHHGFFRCAAVKKLPRQKTRIVSRGSSFRYSGRTHKQIVEYVRDNYVKRQPFQRSQSFRQPSAPHSGVSGGGGFTSSHSAQPLVQAETPTSRSCGSVSLSDDGNAQPTRFNETDVDGRLSRVDKSSSSLAVNGDVQNEQTTNVNELNEGNKKRNANEEEWQCTESPRTATRRNMSLDSTDSDAAVSPLTPPRSICDLSPQMLPKSINEADVRRKRYPPDKAYFIAKEILMTERTYKKDLEVLDVWFREAIDKEDNRNMPSEPLNLLFSNIHPIYQFHCSFLKEVEQRLATWEGRSNAHLKGDHQRVGDLILRHMSMLEYYNQYVNHHGTILEALGGSFETNKEFERVYREFELQKVCYLPINSLILKPLQRLLHYRLLMDRLVKHYSFDHPDYSDCRSALARLKIMIMKVEPILRKSENLAKLVELQRDIVGIDNLVQPGREFIREGCLQKFSKKGFQQRMFFLFSDVLLYTNRTAAVSLQFKVHGQLIIHNMRLEDNTADYPSIPYGFTIYNGNKPFILAASCQEEKDKWVEDLIRAIHSARGRPEKKFVYTTLRTCSSSDEIIDKAGLKENESVASNQSGDKPTQQQRSNTTVHVCWHRNTSISMKDHSIAVENQLSGYLLRKFKNSNGWQKLWVVFTHFCLFFYKSFQDDFPLASLPLLGYSINQPNEKDAISKDYVFKLQFKNHVYFFRAESEYTFGRWMEVISSATQHAGRVRLFSRKESSHDEE